VGLRQQSLHFASSKVKNNIVEATLGVAQNNNRAGPSPALTGYEEIVRYRIRMIKMITDQLQHHKVDFLTLVGYNI